MAPFSVRTLKVYEGQGCKGRYSIFIAVTDPCWPKFLLLFSITANFLACERLTYPTHHTHVLGFAHDASTRTPSGQKKCSDREDTAPAQRQKEQTVLRGCSQKAVYLGSAYTCGSRWVWRDYELTDESKRSWCREDCCLRLLNNASRTWCATPGIYKTRRNNPGSTKISHRHQILKRLLARFTDGEHHRLKHRRRSLPPR